MKDYLLEMAHHVQDEVLFGDPELRTSLTMNEKDWNDIGQPELIAVDVAAIHEDLETDSESLGQEVLPYAKVALGLLVATSERDSDSVINIIESLDRRSLEGVAIFLVGICDGTFEAIATGSDIPKAEIYANYGLELMEAELREDGGEVDI